MFIHPEVEGTKIALLFNLYTLTVTSSDSKDVLIY